MRISTAALLIVLVAGSIFLLTRFTPPPQPTTITEVLTEYATQTVRYTSTSYSTLTEKTTVTYTSPTTVTETVTAPPATKIITTTLPPATTTTTLATTITETFTLPTTLTDTLTKTIQTTVTNTVTKTVQNKTLRNPTWQELTDFLKEDETDMLIYRADEFDCSGFAIKLRDHAVAQGFRCAYVEVEFTDGNAHALTAFQTADKGLVYVDVTGSEGKRGYDKIAYVEAGKEYGTISLDAVRWRYISISNHNPSEFWEPLVYTTHSENSTYPLTYNYYIEYTKRIKFYYETVEAYNKATAEYSSGSVKYTYTQLSNWLSNINTLEEEIGMWWLPMGVVKKIEIYWSD